MTRLLSMDADLSAPPSSVSCYRDVTLWAAIQEYETIAVSPEDMIDLYADWFEKHGVWDYIAAIITPEEAAREAITVQITGGPNARLTAVNLPMVIRLIR